MDVLVTGGSGFIGSRLISRLIECGESVGALVRPEGPRRGLPPSVRTIPADLSDLASVQQAVRQTNPSVVFHAAMPSGHPATAAGRLEALTTAVAGTANLAEAAAETGVRRFVFLGSFLGYRSQEIALRESDPLVPETPRGAAKAAASLWLGQFARANRFSSVELRIFSVYGPGEPPSRLIPTLLRAAQQGTSVALLPHARRDLVYVDDVVDACLRAAGAPVAPGDVYNIAGGKSWSNQEVLDAAQRASGRPIHVLPHAYPAKGADGHWLADISAAGRHLGWSPRFGLHEGLQEAYRCLN